MREKRAVISKQESFSATLIRSYIVFTLRGFPIHEKPNCWWPSVRRKSFIWHTHTKIDYFFLYGQSILTSIRLVFKLESNASKYKISRLIIEQNFLLYSKGRLSDFRWIIAFNWFCTWSFIRNLLRTELRFSVFFRIMTMLKLVLIELFTKSFLCSFAGKNSFQEVTSIFTLL